MTFEDAVSAIGLLAYGTRERMTENQIRGMADELVARFKELQDQLKDMEGEVVRQRKRAALWKRMHWALLEGEFGSGGALCDQIQDECEEQIRAMGEDPEHDAGDPGVFPPGPTETQPDPDTETRMATAPQAGDGAKVV